MLQRVYGEDAVADDVARAASAANAAKLLDGVNATQAELNTLIAGNATQAELDAAQAANVAARNALLLAQSTTTVAGVLYDTGDTLDFDSVWSSAHLSGSFTSAATLINGPPGGLAGGASGYYSFSGDSVTGGQLFVSVITGPLISRGVWMRSITGMAWGTWQGSSTRRWMYSQDGYQASSGTSVLIQDGHSVALNNISNSHVEIRLTAKDWSTVPAVTATGGWTVSGQPARGNEVIVAIPDTVAQHWMLSYGSSSGTVQEEEGPVARLVDQARTGSTSTAQLDELYDAAPGAGVGPGVVPQAVSDAVAALQMNGSTYAVYVGLGSYAYTNSVNPGPANWSYFTSTFSASIMAVYVYK